MILTDVILTNLLSSGYNVAQFISFDENFEIRRVNLRGFKDTSKSLMPEKLIHLLKHQSKLSKVNLRAISTSNN